MKKATLTLILIFLVAPLFVVTATPTNTAVPAEGTLTVQDNVPLNIFQEASDIQREVRVALYDEPSAAPPSYSYSGLWTTNVTLMEILLVDAGFSVTRLTAGEIDGNDTLRTALFDVFVMVDNNPRDSITDEVLNFWRGGGGILSLDGAVSFLCHFGVMVPASAGNHGHGLYWIYQSSTTQTVLSRHPVSQEFAIGHTFTDSLDWATFDWSALQGFTYSNEYTAITHTTTSTNWVNTLARDTERGGRVVQTFGDANPVAVGHDQMIIDAINWLCPRPKARVVFDYTHMPYYGIDAGDPYTGYSGERYAEWRDALVNRTYTVDKLYPSHEGNLTAENLAPYDVLVIAAPHWNFSAEEVDAVRDWVAGGGGLFLMGEANSFSIENDNINYLLNDFDMSLSSDEYTVFSFATSQFEMHPTLESVGSTHYQGGVYVNVTGDAYPLWYDGPNIINAAQEYGMGRVFLVGDINFPGNFIDYEDNVQYCVNLVNWLSAGSLLLYTTEPYSVNYYRTPVANALNELGIPFFLTSDEDYMNFSMMTGEWDLVVLDGPYYSVTSHYGDILDFVNSGGRLIMCSYQGSNFPSNPLWAALGVEIAGDMPDSSPIHIWDGLNPVFNLPHDYGALNFTPVEDYGNEGDLLTVFDNATAVAGLTMNYQDGNATIVLRNDGKTLLNSYLIDQFSGDLDNSTYADNYELWLNEIAYMLRPTIDEPADVEYVEGTTGHSIVWHPHSVYPAEYLIERDGGLVEHEPWVEDTVAIGIDGLATGTYVFVIAVSDRAGYTTIDEVIVTVTEVPTSPTPTTTPTGPPLPPLDPTLLLIIGAAAAGVIIIMLVMIMMKKKKS